MTEQSQATTKRARSEGFEWLGDLVFLVPALLLSFSLAYPIYDVAWFFLVVGVGLLAGILSAWIPLRRHLSVWVSVAGGVGAYLLLGLPVASPEVFWAPNTILTQFVGVLVAPLAGPRQILTLDVPLGTYQQVLAPVFFLAIAVSLAVFNLAWRGGKAWFMAAPLGLVPMAWGIALGTTSQGALFNLPAPLHWLGTRAAIGIVIVLLLFAWLFWRPWLRRKRMVRSAPQMLSGNLTGRWIVSKGFRGALGVLMVSSAILVSVTVTPMLMEHRSRVVLRTDIPVRVEETLEISPLSTYRQYFSEGVFDATMFTVTETVGLERVRIAALDYFDGSTFQANSPQSTQAFQRVPSTISPILAPEQESLRPVSTVVQIGEYQQPWVPLPGALGSLRFEGEHKAELADNLFYNKRTATAIQGFGDGIAENTSYQVDAWNLLAPASAVTAFVPAHQGGNLTPDVPESLVKWVDNQTQAADGAGLVELIDRLRARGYLSHSLLEDDGARTWMSALGPNYQFQASRSGHSLERISRLFVRLNEQEEAAGPDPSAEQLVGAVGDDEQFATAAALIADHLGFNVRVVVGARLHSDTPGELPVCASGGCTGGDMAAWIEVQDGDSGLWAPLDVTPQHSLLLAPRTQQTSDPKNITTVTPAQIQVMPPPQAEPSGGESQTNVDEEMAWEATETGPWLRLAGVVGLGALALLSLPLTIIAAKTLRATRRRKAPSGSARIRGAWAEYADKARDYRYLVEPSSTRMETATQLSFEDDSALHLAHAADYVSFQVPTGGDFDSTEAWVLVGAAKANLGVGTTFWQRVRSRFSLRSFRAGGRE